MVNEQTIRIEVAYATLDEQIILEVHAAPGISARDAVVRSGILTRFPEIDLTKNKLGIFGKLTKPDTQLREGDRVEIYRPLIADPKEQRKKRAAAGKRMKKGGGPAENKS
jgi:putative ubiquitin-RnfH superfamily antitoxin RatB of RatAB toxin-antitoxin module